MSDPDRTLPESLPFVGADTDSILRFRMSERQMHWAVAAPFMVCYVSAMALLAIYSPNPQRPLRWLVSWTHKLSAISLFVFPAWILVRHWYDLAVHVGNIREVWHWTVADLKWLLLVAPAMVSRRIVQPEQGKFNAGEKINFMALTAALPLYFLTGLLIWFHQFAFPAWIVHFTLAVTATPLLFGHLFMALVNPDTRVGLPGMITGYVDRHWAAHHYARWYREVAGEAAASEPAVVEGCDVAPVPVQDYATWTEQADPVIASDHAIDAGPTAPGDVVGFLQAGAG